MPAGRPPKPTVLKVVQGTQRKDRANPGEPSPEVVSLPCPDYLPDRAAEEWNRIVPELVRFGLLTAVDKTALEAYCMAYHRWRQAEEILDEEGLTMVSPNNGEIARPEEGIAERRHKQMLEALREFGLSPSSRGKVKANPPAPKETAMDRLKRKKEQREKLRRGA